MDKSYADLLLTWAFTTVLSFYVDEIRRYEMCRITFLSFDIYHFYLTTSVDTFVFVLSIIATF